MRRRLLEILEQGVGARLRSRSSTASMITDAPGRQRGGGVEQALQAADLIDGDAARELGAACRSAAARAASDRDGCRRRPDGATGWSSGTSRPGASTAGPAPCASTRSAALSANSALPTPSGPASSQAWWSRPASSAVAEGGDRVVMAEERASQQILERGEQPRRDLLRRAARRRSTRKRSGSAAASRSKAAATRAMIVARRGRRSGRRRRRRGARAALAPPSSGRRSSKVRSGRRPWLPISCSARTALEAEPAGAALIGDRAVDEAVAEHPFARVQRRPDGPRDMVGAGGGEEQGLGLRRPALARLQQQRADRLGAGAAAGLARLDDVEAARAQRRRQRLQPGSTCRPPPRLRG